MFPNTCYFHAHVCDGTWLRSPASFSGDSLTHSSTYRLKQEVESEYFHLLVCVNVHVHPGYVSTDDCMHTCDSFVQDMDLLLQYLMHTKYKRTARDKYTSIYMNNTETPDCVELKSTRS